MMSLFPTRQTVPHVRLTSDDDIICYTRADEDLKNTIGAATATGRSTCYPNASRSRKIVKLMACDVKHSVHGTRVMNSNE